MKLAWYEIRWSVGILDEKQLIAIGKFRSESNGNGSRCRPPMANPLQVARYRLLRSARVRSDFRSIGRWAIRADRAGCTLQFLRGVAVSGWPIPFSLKMLKEPD